MTDLSGIGYNLTYTNAVAAKAPYYYISAHLDLAGVILPQQESDGITYYFNKDNNLDYLNPLLSESYHNFHTIDANAVIGDVVLFSNPDLVASAPEDVEFVVGGAIFGEPVSAVWGGPTGYTAGPVGVADINTGVICYYGHEGGHDPENDPSNQMDQKYLAVTIRPSGGASRAAAPAADSNKEAPVIVDEMLASIRARKRKQTRQIVNPDISSGKLHVIIKVYPKSHS
jgi:hypothetical protein